MNLQLAQLYGTPGATQEDVTKTAEAQLFAKLAAENNIDLRALNDGQIQELWGHVFNKTAEEEEKEKEEKEEKEDEDKKEAAAREHQQKLASVREEERAHYLGQVMAHSYVAELGKIAEAQTDGAAVVETDEIKEAAMPPALAKALGRVRGAASSVAGKAKEIGGKAKDFGGKGGAKAKEHGSHALEHVKSHKGAYGAGAAGAGGAGAGFAAGRHSKKEASVIDEMALEHAVKIAHADGRFDLEEVANRVGAVFTLGLDDSTKVASTADQQVEIRALEYLEAAGYPVEWAS